MANVSTKTGLFFGSFNPVHIGHMAIANYMLEFTPIEELWFVVSPQNPFKTKKQLLDQYQRLEMVNRAIEDPFHYKASNIEFDLPRPSYTIDTLAYLTEKFPKRKFVLIMGADSLASFYRWKNADKIIQWYERYVYPRHHVQIDESAHTNIRLVQAPMMEISSSFIRQAIKDEKDVRYFLPGPVYQYIKEMHFYQDSGL